MTSARFLPASLITIPCRLHQRSHEKAAECAELKNCEPDEETCHRSISSFLFRHLGVISFSLTAENSAPTKSSAPSTNSSLFHISSARTSASARDPARITTVLCRVSVISTSNSFMDTPQSMQMQVRASSSTINVTLAVSRYFWMANISLMVRGANLPSSVKRWKITGPVRYRLPISLMTCLGL